MLIVPTCSASSTTSQWSSAVAQMLIALLGEGKQINHERCKGCHLAPAIFYTDDNHDGFGSFVFSCRNKTIQIFHICGQIMGK